MSAIIRVESGIAAGTNYWIDRPVLRIGSDPQCDICLPTDDLAPHALTLEFRGGAYRVYNRGTSPVTLGRSVVRPGSSETWNDADSVLLPGNQRLVLAFDGDPQPCQRPELRGEDNLIVDDIAAPIGAAAVDEEAAKKKSSKTMLQLGVIGFCVLAMVAFLTLGKGEKPVAANRPTFAGIVRSTLAKPADDPIRVFLPQLQYAEAAVVRNNRARAKARYLRLRDQLVHRMETLSDKSREDAKRVLEYVEYQLSIVK